MTLSSKIRKESRVENVVVDHLSRLTVEGKFEPKEPIKDSFPDEQLFAATALPWYANIMNYLVTREKTSH